MSLVGSMTWLIPDCYWPEHTSPGAYVSHESICVLNAGDSDACLRITLYFEDREPMEGFAAQCGARRTHHIRLDRLRNEAGQPVPCGVPYAAMVESTAPVVVQYSRCDTTQAPLTLMTTVAFPL
ncbi:MAG TPA: sensory rhodopsin transducer [Clostridia bacterium]|nr:sensory rhodopsin transducer [Clostridia bacterium]